jgi:putative salt-induced outer membrane protein YdiY
MPIERTELLCPAHFLRGKRRTWLWPLALLLALFPALRARADEVRLATGEVLKVTDVRVTDSWVRFTHPILGTLTVPRGDVAIIAPPPPLTPDDAVAKDKAREEALVRVDAEFDRRKADEEKKARLSNGSFWDGWKRTVEIGANGANGNSDSLSVRAGAKAARIARTMESRAAISYAFSSDQGSTSQNRGNATFVNDWLFEASPWGMFAKGEVEYDQFQDWDWRFSAFAGPSYAFIKKDRVTLLGRLGAGVSREIGGTTNEWIPEGLAGAEFSYQLTPRQRIFVNGEYLPSLTNFPEFRVNAKAGYRIIIDPDSNLSLNLGVNDRYESDPGEGFEPNDVEYFMLLGWEF